MNFLSRLLDLLIDFLALIACLLICLLTGSVALDVIIRGLNLGSLTWVLQGSEYMLYGVTFLAAPWVLRAGGHVNVDVFVRNLPPRIGRLFELASDITGTGVALLLTYYGIKVTAQSYTENIVIYNALVFPEWWILWVAPLTTLCLVGEFTRRLSRGLSARRADASAEL